VNDDPRDDLDRALSRGLSDLASGGDNADAVLAVMRPKLRRARARYRATRVGGAAFVVLLAIGGVALLAPHGRSTKLDVTTNPPTVAPATTTVPAPRRHHAAPITTTTQPIVTQTVPSRLPVTTITRPVSAPPATVVPPIIPKRGDHGPEPVTTTTVPSSPQSLTYSVEGGRLTVRFANGRLTLVSYSADSQWTATVDTQESTDVEVHFVNGESESFIRVRVENGKPVETQDE
jgi:hypothetical protein